MPPSVTHLLLDTANLLRRTETSAGHGRWLHNEVALYSDIGFRVFPAGAREQSMSEQMRAAVTHTGFVEPDQDVAKDDLLQVTSSSGVAISDGPQYRVIAVLPPSVPHHQKLLLEKVQIGKA